MPTFPQQLSAHQQSGPKQSSSGHCHQMCVHAALCHHRHSEPPLWIWAVRVLCVTALVGLCFGRGLFPTSRCQGPHCLPECYREDDSLNRPYHCVFNQGLWGLIKMSPSCFVCSLKLYSLIGLCCIMFFFPLSSRIFTHLQRRCACRKGKVLVLILPQGRT